VGVGVGALVGLGEGVLEGGRVGVAGAWVGAGGTDVVVGAELDLHPFAPLAAKARVAIARNNRTWCLIFLPLVSVLYIISPNDGKGSGLGQARRRDL
jgi:hypothetical protein